MANEYAKKNSALLVIRDLHIKTQLGITRLGKIRKSDDCNHWQECGLKVTLMPCRWKCKLLELVKTAWHYLVR